MARAPRRDGRDAYGSTLGACLAAVAWATVPRRPARGQTARSPALGFSGHCLRSVPVRSQLTGLVLGAAGTGVQVAVAPGSPAATVANAALLLAGALATALAPGRWSPLPGLVAAAWIGAAAASTRETGERLADASETIPYIGTSVQVMGVAVALAAGVVALGRPPAPTLPPLPAARRPSPRPRGRPW